MFPLTRVVTTGWGRCVCLGEALWWAPLWGHGMEGAQGADWLPAPGSPGLTGVVGRPGVSLASAGRLLSLF